MNGCSAVAGRPSDSFNARRVVVTAAEEPDISCGDFRNAKCSFVLAGIWDSIALIRLLAESLPKCVIKARLSLLADGGRGAFCGSRICRVSSVLLRRAALQEYR